MVAERELDVDTVAATCALVLDEVERAVVGKRDALELVLLGLLADGNVLIEDFPGPREDPRRPLARTAPPRSSSRGSSSRPT